MSKRRQRRKLVEEPIAFGATRGDTAVDPGTVPLTSYQDIAGSAVLRQGVAVRYSPEAERLCVVPLGGRVLLGPAGMVDEANPYLFAPQVEPLQFGILGADPPRDLDVLATPAGTGRVVIYEHPARRLLPAAPPVDELLWSPELQEAVEDAVAGGELAGFVVAGLVARFSEASVVELLAGRNPVAAWLERFVALVDAEQATGAASLASMLGIQWSVALRRLDETMDPEDPRWLTELEAALRLRDELASVVRILRRLNRAEAVEAIVVQADREASAWLEALPFALWLQDPYLVEVARREDPFWASRRWLAEP